MTQYSKVVNEITSLGCMVVPKMKNKVEELPGMQQQNQDHLSWRLSFSKSELILSKHIPPQFRYILNNLLNLHLIIQVGLCHSEALLQKQSENSSKYL